MVEWKQDSGCGCGDSGQSAEPSDNGEPPDRRFSDPRTLFRKKFYPGVSKKEWDSWQWQLAHRITDQPGLSRILRLSAAENAALATDGTFPFAVTPYYASLLADDDNDPLRRCVVPREEEFRPDDGEADDPLGETGHEAAPGIVHRYPDRVLFLVASFCSTYCRYCTRSRMVGQGEDDPGKWRQGIAYIRNHPEVRDVLVSGGDPLTLADAALDEILTAIRAIPHVQIIRIGTKTTTVLPQRINSALCKMLRKHHPLYLSIHAAHPREFTPEAVAACARLTDAGIPLGSQTVLLRGVNDTPDTMKTLMHKLLLARVRPYYLYQCDPVRGTSHFRTPVEKGLEIIGRLRGFTTGYAVPTFVVDSPGGGGKIPIAANNILWEENGNLLLRNYEGLTFTYPGGGCGGKRPERPACEKAKEILRDG